MKLKEKIKIISDNLLDFSSADRIQRARLCASMHSEEFEQCEKNIQVFHIADRIGLFSKTNTGFSMTGKTRKAIKELKLK